MKHLKKFNEGILSGGEESELDRIKDKIREAAWSLKSPAAWGSMNKNASFINGVNWAIHNLTDDEIKYLRENTDPDDHSFLGF